MNAANPATSSRPPLLLAAQQPGRDEAVEFYRAVAAFRDALPAPAKRQLAAALEWAREGLAKTADDETRELLSLAAAYQYAVDVLLASANKASAPHHDGAR